MVDLINRSYHVKILTIEDPVEFEHISNKALIAHVEVGRDTPSFEHGLRQAMRQAPDVILIGEIRDADTAQMALAPPTPATSCWPPSTPPTPRRRSSGCWR